MKAVAYGIRPFEKEFLARANQKKHDITLISNALGADTVIYAEGKDAVIVFDDGVSADVLKNLAALGIKYIITRFSCTEDIDQEAAAQHGIKLSIVRSYALAEEALQEIANQTIKNLDLWQMNKCVGKACMSALECKSKNLDGTLNDK